jgi:uncharacterized protein YheU (UPF0270 family)
VKIPWKELSSQTLDSLLEEIVTRDGTDYGVQEKTTEQKVILARNQLKSGLATLYWNTELESATLLNKTDAERLELVSKSDPGK